MNKMAQNNFSIVIVALLSGYSSTSPKNDVFISACIEGLFAFHKLQTLSTVLTAHLQVN